METQKPNKKSERGVALLIAVSALALMMGFVADIILSTSVNLEMSSSVRDRIKSEYMAKSGFNLGLYLFSITWGVELVKPQLTGEKGVLLDNAESYWNLINELPHLGAAAIKMQEELEGVLKEDVLNLSGVMNEENRRIMSLFEDSFKITVEDENGKINVNDCATGRCKNVVEGLVALFSAPVEKEFLKEKNLEPEQLAFRIKDFISKSKQASPETGDNNKDAYYEKQEPPYATKKGVPFDSLDELKLVQGWDDEVHAVFAPYLTVYPFNNVDKGEVSKVNINTASTELLSSLVPSSLSDSCRENFLKKMKKMTKEKTAVAGKDISAALKDLMCYSPGIDSEEKPAENRANWFSKHSSAFRIKVEGVTGLRKTILTVVIKRLNPGEKVQGKDKSSLPRSYQILSWSLS